MATGKSLLLREIQPVETFFPIEGSEKSSRKQRNYIKKLIKRAKRAKKKLVVGPDAGVPVSDDLHG